MRNARWRFGLGMLGGLALMGCTSTEMDADAGVAADAEPSDAAVVGAFTRSGAFILSAEVPAGDRTETRRFVLFTDETGRPTHLGDNFFEEMNVLVFSGGVAVLGSRAAGPSRSGTTEDASRSSTTCSSASRRSATPHRCSMDLRSRVPRGLSARAK
ncbi:MAG: hypothetical protein AB8I08_18980 [Sandaracinaceae bacterium]